MTNKTAMLFLACLLISALIWFMMNLGFIPRFTLHPYEADKWLYISFVANILLGCLFLLLKQKKYAFYPFFFAMFPLAIIITSCIVPLILGRDFSGANLYKKFLNDCIFFSIEILLMTAIAKIFKVDLDAVGFKKKSLIKKDKILPEQCYSKKWDYGILAFNIFFCSALTFLLYSTCKKGNISISRFIELLPFQILFAVLLGYKEEFFFRWSLAKKIEEHTSSWLLTLLIPALLWGLYHFFFGEGVGTGFASGIQCFIISLWWGFSTLRSRNIRWGWLCHFMIEMYGFYLMYLPFL